MSRSIVITGASSGIGAALVADYAGPDVSFLLIGRDGPRLDAVAEAARKAGARTTTALVDVTEDDAMRAAILAHDDASPVDLVIANAGVSASGMPEPQGQARRVIEVNVFGVLNTVEPLIPRMIARGAGRIALVSSIAALRPLGDLPSYSASKAAVRAYGQAIRSKLRGAGVSVTVICPGFVTTPMTARHIGFKPFETPAPRAAAIMRRAIEARRGALTFPWPLAVLTFLGNRLPPALSDWFERRFAAEVRKD